MGGELSRYVMLDYSTGLLFEKKPKIGFGALFNLVRQDKGLG